MQDILECRIKSDYVELNIKDNTLFVISTPFPDTLPYFQVRIIYKLKRRFIFFYSLISQYKMTGDANYTSIEENKSDWVKMDLITSLRYCFIYFLHFISNLLSFNHE